MSLLACPTTLFTEPVLWSFSVIVLQRHYFVVIKKSVIHQGNTIMAGGNLCSKSSVFVFRKKSERFMRGWECNHIGYLCKDTSRGFYVKLITPWLSNWIFTQGGGGVGGGNLIKPSFIQSRFIHSSFCDKNCITFATSVHIVLYLFAWKIRWNIKNS